MKDIFENRQLSRIQSGKIAKSQNDLGGKSQDDMIMALGGIKNAKSYPELINTRIDAFNRLDSLSKTIVLACLENDIEGAINQLQYSVNQTNRAISALREIYENE